MIGGGQGQAFDGAIVPAIFDNLEAEINRPDLFLDQTTQRSGIKRSDRNLQREHQLISAIVVVALSGFLFITVVGWATVLQSYLDSKFVNPVIANVTKSRLYYAIIVTIITIIVVIVVAYIFLKYQL